MRLFYAIIIIALNSALVFGQEAEFRFDRTVHKFPPTRQGVLLEHTFVVSNTGDVPLIINDFKVSCSCTKAYLPTDSILPGESFDLKVTFDTTGKYDFQDRLIYLQTNSKKGSATLRFKVRVLTK